MAKSEFIIALEQLAEERGLPIEKVIETVEHALAAAYRKEYGKPRQIVRAVLNKDDITKTEMFQVFNVVANIEDQEAVAAEADPIINENGEEVQEVPVFEPENQIEIDEAKEKDKALEIGDELVVALPHHEDFGRIAAQTAKQVIIQRLAEAEREMISEEFKNREGEVLPGTVQQIEGRDVVVNIGKAHAIMPKHEQIQRENYYVGQRLKVLVLGVEETNRGPKVVVSRSNPDFIRGLFTHEVPEIQAGTVTIESIAREAGSRTKMAVAAHQEGLDPVGSCVGQRGIRVQAVLSEVGDEKIDIILWDADAKKLIANALSPAKADNIEINEEEKRASVNVPADQVSLAIGRDGQNVRLASKLTGWEIDIIKDQEAPAKSEEEKEEPKEDKEVQEEE